MFSYVSITKEKPNVRFLEGCIPSKYMIQTKDDINNYVEVCEKTNNSLTILGLQVNEMYNDFEKNLSKWNDDYSYLVEEDLNEK